MFITGIIKKVLPLILVGIFAGFTIYGYYPGFMSADSMGQWTQALTGNFNDWHPPIMSFFWRWLSKIFFGASSSLFIFHVLVYWACWYLLGQLSKSVLIAIAVPFTGLVPSLFVQTTTIWKDTAFSTTMLSAFLCVYFLRFEKKRESRSSWTRPICLTLLLILSFYAISLRHNSLPALVPLTYYFYYKGLELKLPKPRKQIAALVLAGVTPFVLYFGSEFVSDELIGATKTYPSQQVQIHDIQGIITSLQTLDYVPDYWFSRFDIKTDVLRFYEKGCIQRTLAVVIPPTQNLEFLGQLRTQWIRAILEQPLAYFRHRRIMFQYLLRYKMDPPCEAYSSGIDPNNPYGLTFSPNHVTRYFSDRIKAAAPHFKGYVVLATVLLALLLSSVSFFWGNSPLQWLAMCLSSSGLLYMLGYFICLTCCDFRFIYWSNLSAYASLAVLFIVLYEWLAPKVNELVVRRKIIASQHKQK